MDMDLFIALGIFLCSLLLVLILRNKIGKDYEIKNSDILIGIVPLALWLLLTGKITNFEYGDLKISSAFAKASNQSISGTINEVYDNDIVSAEKESLVKLEQILASKPEALIFYSGKDQRLYASGIIKDYFVKLSASTLQYLIILDTENEFIGMISLDRFMQTISEDPTIDLNKFAQWLNNGEDNKFSEIKGFITDEQAVSKTTSKIQALEKIEELKTKFLPVVEQNKLIGIIERDQLSTSLLMDISKNINQQ